MHLYPSPVPAAALQGKALSEVCWLWDEGWKRNPDGLHIFLTLPVLSQNERGRVAACGR